MENHELDEIFIQFIINSYVYNNNNEQFVLALNKDPLLSKSIKQLMESESFNSIEESDDFYAIIFNIPEKVKFSYDKFLSGKYSEISNTDKNTILDFAKTHFSEDTYDIMCKILMKDKSLKAYWMEVLGLNEFPDNLEVSSIIDTNVETYYGKEAN